MPSVIPTCHHDAQRDARQTHYASCGAQTNFFCKGEFIYLFISIHIVCCFSAAHVNTLVVVVVVVVVVVYSSSSGSSIGQTVGSISSKTLVYDCLYTLELCTASALIYKAMAKL